VADDPQPAALDLAHAALSEAIASIDASIAYERNWQFELAERCAAVSIAESLATIAEQLVTLNEHGIETYQLDADGHRKES
jgi:hypothetical protein